MCIRDRPWWPPCALRWVSSGRAKSPPRYQGCLQAWYRGGLFARPELTHLRAHGGHHGRAHPGSDRLYELTPHGHRLVDPLGTAPGVDGAGGGRQVGHGVDPEVGDFYGLLDLAASDITNGRVTFCSNGLASDVGGELDIERLSVVAGEHGLELGSDDGHGAGVHLVDAHGSQRLGHLGVVS